MDRAYHRRRKLITNLLKDYPLLCRNSISDMFFDFFSNLFSKFVRCFLGKCNRNDFIHASWRVEENLKKPLNEYCSFPGPCVRSDRKMSLEIESFLLLLS